MVDLPPTKTIGDNSVFGRVRNKNLSLLAGEYNTSINKIRAQGTIFADESSYKDVQKKRESILARLDTDINIEKNDGGYDVELFGVDKINGLEGVGKEVKVLRNSWIDRGSPGGGVSKHKISCKSQSLSLHKYRVDKAIRSVMDYKHNRVLNSVPVNKNILKG